jgi:hypothetical protein
VKSPQLATQPRHAINQLSNLHQSHQAVETNSRIYSPIVQGNFAEAARKVSSSVTPVFRHAIMGDHSKNISNPLNPTKPVPNTTNTSSLSPNSNRVVREVMRVTQLGGTWLAGSGGKESAGYEYSGKSNKVLSEKIAESAL